MTHESIHNLLTEADRLAARPPITPDLQRSVFARVRRRRTARRTALLATLFVAMVPLIQHRQPPEKLPSAPPMVAATTQSPQNWDAIVQARTAEQILILRDRRMPSIKRPIDPLQKLRMENDVTAATLITAGDYLSRDPASAAQGHDHFQRVRTYFPKTSWSAQAALRLSHDRS